MPLPADGVDAVDDVETADGGRGVSAGDKGILLVMVAGDNCGDEDCDVEAEAEVLDDGD